MNLIEQLGGYGKAKKALIDAQNSNNIDPIIYINDQEVLTDCVCDALTQYRRENNIFEVGDKVVLVGYWYADTVWTVTAENKDMVSLIGGNIPGFSSVIISIVRHATPKEIAQGYRDE